MEGECERYILDGDDNSQSVITCDSDNFKSFIDKQSSFKNLLIKIFILFCVNLNKMYAYWQTCSTYL